MAELRYRVDPGDVPAEKAARRLGLTLAEFNAVLPRLLSRGFPEANPTRATTTWMRSTHGGAAATATYFRT